jgi:hypothetical protein
MYLSAANLNDFIIHGAKMSEITPKNRKSNHEKISRIWTFSIPSKIGGPKPRGASSVESRVTAKHCKLNNGQPQKGQEECVWGYGCLSAWHHDFLCDWVHRLFHRWERQPGTQHIVQEVTMTAIFASLLLIYLMTSTIYEIIVIVYK